MGFTRSRGIWSPQGKQLVGSGAIGMARQGASVALSADGNTAMVGGWSDHDRTGAVWVFSRSRGIWSQQGKKLVGSGAVGAASQGMSLALSADGNTALIGGPSDSPSDSIGALWSRTGGRSMGIHPQRGGLDAARREARQQRRYGNRSAGHVRRLIRVTVTSR